MAKGPRYRVPFRRRREGKTNYRTRKRLLTSELPRTVVRCTSKNTYIQFVEFDPKRDIVIAAANTKELKKMGWKSNTANIPAAYLAGLLAGKRALEKKIDKAVPDIGLHSPSKGNKVFAALKGLVDAGIKIPIDPKVIPDEARIKGEHMKGEVSKELEAVALNIRGDE